MSLHIATVGMGMLGRKDATDSTWRTCRTWKALFFTFVFCVLPKSDLQLALSYTPLCCDTLCAVLFFACISLINAVSRLSLLCCYTCCVDSLCATGTYISLSTAQGRRYATINRIPFSRATCRSTSSAQWECPEHDRSGGLAVTIASQRPPTISCVGSRSSLTVTSTPAGKPPDVTATLRDFFRLPQAAREGVDFA